MSHSPFSSPASAGSNTLDAAALTRCGLQRHRHGDMVGASADLNAAIAQNLVLADAYYLRAALLAKMGEPDEGMADYTHAKQLDADPAKWTCSHDR